MATEQKLETSEENTPTYQKNINLLDEDEEKSLHNYKKYLEVLNEYYKLKDTRMKGNDFRKKFAPLLLCVIFCTCDILCVEGTPSEHTFK